MSPPFFLDANRLDIKMKVPTRKQTEGMVLDARAGSRSAYICHVLMSMDIS